MTGSCRSMEFHGKGKATCGDFKVTSIDKKISEAMVLDEVILKNLAKERGGSSTQPWDRVSF